MPAPALSSRCRLAAGLLALLLAVLPAAHGQDPFPIVDSVTSIPPPGSVLTPGASLTITVVARGADPNGVKLEFTQTEHLPASVENYLQGFYHFNTAFLPAVAPNTYRTTLTIPPLPADLSPELAISFSLRPAVIFTDASGTPYLNDGAAALGPFYYDGGSPGGKFRNPSFEASTFPEIETPYNTGANLDGWSIISQAGAQGLQAFGVIGGTPFGAQYLNLQNNAGYGGVQQTLTGLQPNARYSFTFAARAFTNADDGVRIAPLDFFVNGTKQATFQPLVVTLDERLTPVGWTTYSQEFTADAAGKATLTFYHAVYNSIQLDINLDNFTDPVLVNGAGPQAFDASIQFSGVQNPSGVWSYGTLQPLVRPEDGAILPDASRFTPFPAPASYFDGAISYSRDPHVLLNPTAAPILLLGYIPVAPGQLSLHPGQEGVSAVLRFTAPAAGDYNVQAVFQGIDPVQTTTRAYVLKKGSIVFQEALTEVNVPRTFSQTVTVAAAGDTLDFVVDDGGDGFSYDSTGLTVTITPPGAQPPPPAGDALPPITAFGVSSSFTPATVGATFTFTAAEASAAPGLTLRVQSTEEPVSDPAREASWTDLAGGQMTRTPGTNDWTAKTTEVDSGDPKFFRVIASAPGFSDAVTNGKNGSALEAELKVAQALPLSITTVLTGKNDPTGQVTTPGDKLTCSLTIENKGPRLQNLRLVSQLPDHTRLSKIRDGGTAENVTVIGNTKAGVAWDIASLGTGDKETYSYQVKVENDAPVEQPLAFDLAAAFLRDLPTIGPARATGASALVVGPISVTARDDGNPSAAVRRGERISYVLEVRNNTKLPVLDARITDDIPRFTSFVSSEFLNDSGGVIPAPARAGGGANPKLKRTAELHAVNKVTWFFGDLAPGARGRVRLTVQVNFDLSLPAGARIENFGASASVRDKEGATIKAPEKSVFKAVANAAAGDPLPVGTPILLVTKFPLEPGDAQESALDLVSDLDYDRVFGAEAGDPITLKLQTANLGSGPADETVVIDRVPEGAVCVEGSARYNNRPIAGNAFQVADDGRTVRFFIGSVPVGTVQNVTYQVQVLSPGAPGAPRVDDLLQSIGGKAHCRQLEAEPEAIPALTLIKVLPTNKPAFDRKTGQIPGTVQFFEGETVKQAVFNVTLRNIGSGKSKDFVFQDRLPAGVTRTGEPAIVSGPAGSYTVSRDAGNREVILYTFPIFPAGAEAKLSVPYEVPLALAQAGGDLEHGIAYADRKNQFTARAGAPAPVTRLRAEEPVARAAEDLTASFLEGRSLFLTELSPDSYHLRTADQPRLFVAKMVPRSVLPGQEFNVTLVVGNTANVPCPSARLSIELPRGTEAVSSTLPPDSRVSGGFETLTVGGSFGFIARVTDLKAHETLAVNVRLRATGAAGTLITDRSARVAEVNDGFTSTYAGVSRTFIRSDLGELINVQLYRQSIILGEPSVADALNDPDFDLAETFGAEATDTKFIACVGGADYLQFPAFDGVMVPTGDNQVAAFGPVEMFVGGRDAASVIAAGAGNVVAGGGGNVVAGGGGNIVAAGAGNLIVVQNLIGNDGANVIATDGASLIARVVAGGGGNVIAAGAGNIVAAGAGNLIGNDGTGIIGNDGAGILARDSAIRLVSNGLIANDGGTFGVPLAQLIGNDGAGIVAAGAGNITSNNGAQVLEGGAGDVLALKGGFALAAGGAAVVRDGRLLGTPNVSRVIAAGAGNIVAGGAGNVVAGGAGNVVAGGAGNIKAARAERLPSGER